MRFITVLQSRELRILPEFAPLRNSTEVISHDPRRQIAANNVAYTLLPVVQATVSSFESAPKSSPITEALAGKLLYTTHAAALELPHMRYNVPMLAWLYQGLRDVAFPLNLKLSNGFVATPDIAPLNDALLETIQVVTSDDAAVSALRGTQLAGDIETATYQARRIVSEVV